jgi:uncharacterized protein
MQECFPAMKAKEERRALKKLYSQIPTFKCRPGCSDCCGPVVASKTEREDAPFLNSFEDTMSLVDVLSKGGSGEELAAGPLLANLMHGCSSCPYVIENGGGCAIYSDRPFLCRLFGTSEDEWLTCPHGCGPTKKLSVEQTRKLYHQYIKLM